MAPKTKLNQTIPGSNSKRSKAYGSLIGERFGSIVVRGFDESQIHKDTRLICECDCGKTFFPSAGNVKRGLVKSCGCSRRRQRHSIPAKIEWKTVPLQSGMVLSKSVDGSLFTVVGRTEPHKNTDGTIDAMYQVVCQCGNTRIESQMALLSGYVLDCGCRRNARRAAMQKGVRNVYTPKLTDTDGKEFFIGYASNSGSPFKIDAEDFPTVAGARVQEVKRIRSNGSVVSDFVMYQDGKRSVLHRVVEPDVDFVRFRDGDRENNRKGNLQEISRTQIMWQRGKTRANTSGVIGVSQGKNKWYAQICGYAGPGTHLWLGSFGTYEEAVRARLEAEKKYCGVYAPQKHLFKKYGIKD